MGSATFRFYGELNDFLAPERRQAVVLYRFLGHPAVKDAIEALGVPHPEVDVIVVNGEAVGFAHRLSDGDRVAVYPAFAAIEPPAGVRVGPAPLTEPRFVLDAHLGRLAAYLRMLGFDTLYRNDAADEELARASAEEGRILLTMDRGLLKRGEVVDGRCVRAVRPREQLVEVVRRYRLAGAAAPFRRCLRCNGELVTASRQEVRDRLPPRTLRFYDAFRRCPSCDTVYWKGSHHARMERLIAQVLSRRRTTGTRAIRRERLTGRRGVRIMRASEHAGGNGSGGG